MKIQQFLKSISWNSNNEGQDKIVKSHPLQWIDKELPIPLWEVKYKYQIRGKTKEHVKYIIANEYHDPDEILHKFKLWCDEYNNQHPYRALSNVEILDTSFVDSIILELE